MEWKHDDFIITDDRTSVDIEVVSRLLASTYWGHRRPRSIIEKLISNSLCFSLLHLRAQVGFARVATDYTVFSWLSDLVIADEYRKRGLGKWLLECILGHPAISHTQFVLQTTTAQEFYEGYGFEASLKLMTRPPPVQ